MKRLRPWLEFAALLGLGTGIVVAAVILPNRAKTAALERQRRAVDAEVSALRSEVDRLDAEIEALRSDPWFVERRLRSELHFLRPNETVVEIEER